MSLGGEVANGNKLFGEPQRGGCVKGIEPPSKPLNARSKMKCTRTEGNLGHLELGLPESLASEMTTDPATPHAPPAFSPHLHFGRRVSSPWTQINGPKTPRD